MPCWACGVPIPQHKRSALLDRLSLAAKALSDEDLELVIVQTVAVSCWRQRPPVQG